MHRFLRLVCLAAAVAALLVSAQVARRLALMGMKEIGTIDNTVPQLTRFLVVRVADGSLPMMAIAGAFAAVVAIVGLYAIRSRRLSPEASGTILLLTCTVAFNAALLLLGTMAIAISIGRAPVP